MQVKENPSWNRLYIIFGIGWLKNYPYGLEFPKKKLINFSLFYIDHLANSSQLAPNLITLIGLAFNGASFLMLLFYRSNNGSASSSIYFFNAISLFVYQVKILIFRRLIFSVNSPKLIRQFRISSKMVMTFYSASSRLLEIPQLGFHLSLL